MIKPIVLVLSSTYPRWAKDPEPGFVHELSKRLTECFEVHVLSPHAPGCVTQETLDGVEVHRFRYAPSRLETLVQNGGIINNLKHQPWKWLLLPPFFLASLASSWSLSRRLKPTAIHAHWIIPQGLVYVGLHFFLRKPVPMLLTIHGGDLFALRSPLMTWLKRRVIRQASTITVVSQAMMADLIPLGARSGQVHVVPMGVDFDVFAPASSCPRNRHEILFVGRLVDKKGVHHLLHAMPLVLSQVPQAHLSIVGHGPEENRLRALANNLGIGDQIRFLGALPQAELPGLYQRAALFVAPFVEASSGDREGLGLVTVEAIACGCPVIVGNLPAIDDILEPADANLRIDPRLPQALAKQIVHSLQQPEEAQAQALRIRTRLMARLGWEQVAKRYESLLSEFGSANQSESHE